MKKILVVDDSQTVRQLVVEALASSPVEVVQAEDGVDGIEKLSLHPDVAMVITDVNMPRMSGIEMLSQIKREPRHAALPFLVLTTESAPELIREAKRAGARAWLVKPFKAQQLASAVATLAA